MAVWLLGAESSMYRKNEQDWAGDLLIGEGRILRKEVPKFSILNNKENEKFL